MATQTSYTPEEASERLDHLPPEIRSYLYSPDMASALESVGKKYALHIDQMGALEGEVTGALLGFTEPQDFAGMVEERVGVTQAIADAMVQDVNALIFEKIRSALKRSTGGGGPAPALKTPPPPARPPVPQAAAPAMPKMAAPSPQPMPQAVPPPRPVAVPPPPPPTAAPRVTPPPRPVVMPPPPPPPRPAAPPAPQRPPAVFPPAPPVAPKMPPQAAPPNLPAAPLTNAGVSAPLGLHPADLPLMGATSTVAKTVEAAPPPPPAGKAAGGEGAAYSVDPYREIPE